VLASSREPLNLRGERQFAVSPLPAPDAVHLFVERASAVGALVEQTATVEAVCRRLDCLPLALELAAARASTLSPEQLLTRLDTRLDLLTRGPRDAPERQRTLRATIEWSYALLNSAEQSAFARLAVFAGGCTLEAAEQVCETSLETLESLVDKSLLKLDGEHFTMLETIHEYAVERLLESGEDEVINRRLLDQLYHAAGRFADERELGHIGPLAELERELDNIRAAMRAGLEWPNDPHALRLVAALRLYWTASGRYAEGLRWTAEALERAGRVSGSTRAEGLRAAAQLASLSAEAEEACAYGEEALALYRVSGDDQGLGSVLRWLANAYSQTPDTVRSRELHAESIALQERLGDSLQLARALRLAGEDELAIGDPARAADLFSRSLALAWDAHGDTDVVMTLHRLGDVSVVEGDAAGAAGYYLQALGASSDSAPVVYCLAGLAAAGALERHAESSGRMWGAVESHQQRLGDPLIHPNTLRRYAALLTRVEGPTFDAAVVAGHDLALDAAVQEAVETFGPWATPPPDAGSV
jgi:tetratricopeptide (TPR) repeat protein